MNPIKTALIGCGKGGHLHARALRDLPESDFVAVCGRNLAKTQEFARGYGVKAYDDVERMIGETGVRAVCVCTPHPQHAEPSVRAMNAGAHVLVDKPLASTLADCDVMIEAARVNKVKLATLSQRRFYEPCQRIRRAIDGGKIGRPMLGVVTMYGWRDQAYYASDPWRGTWAGEGGGVLVNQAPHQLDLLLWYMGEVEEVCGYWANFNHPYIEVEDTAVAIVKFRSGGLGQILVSNSQNPALYGRVQISGSNGSALGVQTDSGAMFVAGVSNIGEPAVNDVWTVSGEEKLLAAWRVQDMELFKKTDPTSYYHGLQIHEFLHAIDEDQEPAVTGGDGRRTVELFTAVYKSQREGKPIRFPM